MMLVWKSEWNDGLDGGANGQASDGLPDATVVIH